MIIDCALKHYIQYIVNSYYYNIQGALEFISHIISVGESKTKVIGQNFFFSKSMLKIHALNEMHVVHLKTWFKVVY